MTKSRDLAARALIPSVVRDESQIYLGHSADVDETEGLSTPTEERDDLLIWNIWKRQTYCILDVRITNLDAPSNILGKPEAVLLSHVRSLPMWFHAMECSEMKLRYCSIAKPCRKPRQEIRKVLFRKF